MRGLQALAEENICQRYFLISQDSLKRKDKNINILPWQEFLELLWNDQII